MSAFNVIDAFAAERRGFDRALRIRRDRTRPAKLLARIYWNANASKYFGVAVAPPPIPRRMKRPRP